MITFTESDVDRYLAEDPGGPVVMLNLLRFRPDGGQQSYADYAEALAPLREDYGLDVVYAGMGGAALVPSGADWDMVVLVRYPSRRVFADMVADPRYQAAEHLRTGALLDSVLQPTVPLPG